MRNVFYLFSILLLACNTNRSVSIEVNCPSEAIEVYLGITNFIVVPHCDYDSVIPSYKGDALEGINGRFEFPTYSIDFDSTSAVLNVVGFKKGKKYRLPDVPLKIKEWGQPIASVGGVYMDSIPIRLFKAQGGIICSIHEPLEIRCSIKSYTFSVVRLDSVIFEDTVYDTPLWSPRIKDFKNFLKVGDKVIVDEIKVDCRKPERNSGNRITHYLIP